MMESRSCNQFTVVPWYRKGLIESSRNNWYIKINSVLPTKTALLLDDYGSKCNFTAHFPRAFCDTLTSNIIRLQQQPHKPRLTENLTKTVPQSNYTTNIRVSRDRCQQSAVVVYARTKSTVDLGDPLHHPHCIQDYRASTRESTCMVN